MDTTKDTFTRDWSLKWAEGAVLGFVKGRLDAPRTLGMLRTAKRKLGVPSEDLSAILRGVEENPARLPGLTRPQKAARLRPLREAIERGEI